MVLCRTVSSCLRADIEVDQLAVAEVGFGAITLVDRDESNAAGSDDLPEEETELAAVGSLDIAQHGLCQPGIDCGPQHDIAVVNPFREVLRLLVGDGTVAVLAGEDLLRVASVGP